MLFRSANTVNQQQKVAIKNLNTRKVETEKEQNDLKQELAEAKSHCSDKDDALTELKTALANKETELEKIHQTDDKLKIAELELQIGNLKEDIAAINTNQSQLRAELRKKEEKIAKFPQDFISIYKSYFDGMSSNNGH